MTDKRMTKRAVKHTAKQTIPIAENNKHGNLKVLLSSLIDLKIIEI
jgi:hypothetical protein